MNFLSRFNYRFWMIFFIPFFISCEFLKLEAVLNTDVLIENSILTENIEKYGNNKLRNKKTKVKALPQKFYLIMTCRKVGMFWTFLSIIGALYHFEKGVYSGVKVAFGDQGTYYQPEMGGNWWEYYFERIATPHTSGGIYTSPYGPTTGHFSDFTEYNIYRKKAYELIKKYVHVKPHVQNIVDQFVESHFNGGPVIGVHYRGTDKYIEAPRANYDLVDAMINEEIAKIQTDQFQIFVATDEQAFLDYMLERHPERVIFYEDAIRSTDGYAVHLKSKENYKKGEDAVVDCLLLSKCDLLMKTSSNLSLCASYFNPDIRVVNLSLRHRGIQPLEAESLLE
jgi:hypothetical protein